MVSVYKQNLFPRLPAAFLMHLMNCYQVPSSCCMSSDVCCQIGTHVNFSKYYKASACNWIWFLLKINLGRKGMLLVMFDHQYAFRQYIHKVQLSYCTAFSFTPTQLTRPSQTWNDSSALALSVYYGACLIPPLDCKAALTFRSDYKQHHDDEKLSKEVYQIKFWKNSNLFI